MSEQIISGRPPQKSISQDTANSHLAAIESNQTDTLFNYKLSNIDDASDPVYLGYLAKDGAWYIQKITSAGAVTYAAGASSYNFANRVSETYAVFSTIF